MKGKIHQEDVTIISLYVPINRRYNTFKTDRSKEIDKSQIRVMISISYSQTAKSTGRKISNDTKEQNTKKKKSI